MKFKRAMLIGATTAGLLFLVSVFHSSGQEPPSSPSNSSKVTVVNGLDTQVLGGLVKMLENNPEKGRVTFYSNSRWQDGMRAFTTFTGYKIDGKMHHEKERRHVLLGDEAVELSGTDAAPGAVEEMMYALGTCIIAAANANAAMMDVKLDRLEVKLESDMDLHGLFAVDKEVRPGVQNLRANIIISGDADEETLEKIAMAGYTYSPVSESLRNGVSFTPSVKVTKSSATSKSTATVVNGLDTQVLGGLVKMLKNNPEKGRVTFYSNSRWQDGMRAFTTFTGYKIDGKMHHEKDRKHVLLGDEAVELSGTDTAPGAVEEMMYALGTCIIAAANANAAMMGVKLDRLEVNLESDVDLHGLFAVDEEVRAGVQNLRANIVISGDADEETLEKIAMSGYTYSPVSETIRNGISFTPSVKIANP